ncbi:MULTISPECIES: DNA replication initiation control protein YabA [unclassified Staphylococcus]|uniref:DNA replication initiation control protein YabA n=1 Tax=unclassified Staphylococcus TaxID=91994 RepID=UPI0021D046B2|nr:MULTISPECIES: DNA replication initiation control protein YabA [unclassified Staphylococcus]UXR78506.1 DNA replication initiation control protein YabA [Staphylococcus sp. IVB6227]UXR82663.1 DNA replication initiation control protein YabA [Staphylococcus sp. IVB6214]
MDRNELFNHLTQLENNVNRIQEDMQALKSLTVALVEENVALQIENDNLKTLMNQEPDATPVERVSDEPEEKKTPQKKQLQSREYFATLYHEGFHICHDVFGKHRNGQDCIFCMNILNDKL